MKSISVHAALAAILVFSTLVGGMLAMEPNLMDHNLQSHGALMERAGQLPNWISLIGVTDRNLHNWWIELNKTWTGYNIRLHEHDNNPDEFYCPNYIELNRTLVNLWEKADLVKSGIEDKLEQFSKIRATLEDPSVIGATGFHCGKATLENGTDISNSVNLTQANMPPRTITLINTLCTSIKNLTNIAKDEERKINKEIRQVEIEIEIIEHYVCDCTYYGWNSNHSTTKDSCSKDCGNGTLTETRKVRWEKKNSGSECREEDGKRLLPCNDFCCPHACHWNTWGIWKPCSDSCAADTQECRERTKNITETCPSEPGQDSCTGDSSETISTCSNIRGKKDKIQRLENELSASEDEVDRLIALLCPKPCLNGGECVGYEQCQCQLGFIGTTCETPNEVTCNSGKYSGGKCKSDNCLTNVTLTPGTKWKQPFCSEDRCLTSQISGPGLNMCENNTDDGMDREINVVNNVVTKWCHGKEVRTVCHLPPVTTTTTTTTSATTTVITTTTIPTTTSAISYDFVEGGCYEDRVLPNSKRERMLTGDYAYLANNSLSACNTFCQKFNYFGVQNTYDCFCGSIIHHLTPTAQSECSEACPGESSQKCGGSYRQNLYSKNSPKATGVCDVTQCTATVYKDCPDKDKCGTKNGVSCEFISSGIGSTGCGWNPCTTVKGTGDWQATCGGGDAIDVTGGCVAQVAKDSFEYELIMQTGFTGLWKRYENDHHFGDNFNKVKLSCPATTTTTTTPITTATTTTSKIARISSENGQPEVYINGIWSPICGHWFWDNGNGANLFCQELMNTNGRIAARGQTLASNGAIIGRCDSNDKSILSCTGNKPSSGMCAAGYTVGIKITCDAPPTTTTKTTTATTSSNGVLIMKLKAGSNFFGYDSEHWTTDTTYNPDEEAKYSDDMDAKLPAFNTHPLKTITICYKNLTNCYDFELGFEASSALALFRGGYHRSDDLGGGGRQAFTDIFLPPGDRDYNTFWDGKSGKDSLPAYVTQMNPGINSVSTDSNKARIGYAVNRPRDSAGDGDKDGAIGIGLSGQYGLSGKSNKINAPWTGHAVRNDAVPPINYHQAWLFAK